MSQLELPFPPEYIEIPLSKRGKHAGKYTAIVSPEDADLTGIDWSVLKTNGQVYANRKTKINGRYTTIHLHRVILERELGRPLVSNEFADHIDRNPLNNTRANLRLATYSQNLANRQTRSPYGYKGVSWQKRRNKWVAQIGFNLKNHFIGYFDTPEEAHAAYCKKATELFGEFANYESKPA